MPPRIWAYGVAIYTINLELSLNISASLEGWFVDNLSWKWIFWQNIPLAIGMVLCLHLGTRSDSTTSNRPPPDLYGFAFGGLALAFVYAALDQGNRLDWANSGLVWGLVLAGIILFAAFLLHELHTAHPGINLKIVFKAPLPRTMTLIALVRLTILSTSFVIPQFLQVVRGFRALEVGGTLVWIAVPQFLVAILAGFLLRRTDARFVSSAGLMCICAACLVVAHGLTPVWGTDQFLPSQLLQAVGQTLALSGIVFFGILHLRPQDALTYGACAQVARLMGGEFGSAFITTFVRIRGQIASNLLGLHVQIGDGQVMQRLEAYASATSRAGDPGNAIARGASVLNSVIHSMSITLAIVDAFVVLAVVCLLTVMFMVTRKSAPLGPASHVPLFGQRAPAVQ
jgi:DHA2 family multidrug resistance protein